MRIFLSLLLSIVLSTAIQAQSFWNEIRESQISQKSRNVKSVNPTVYRTFSLEASQLKDYLLNAPTEEQEIERSQGFTLLMPSAEGTVEEFVVWYSPVMEEELAAKYPEIRSYKGYKKNQKSTIMRLTVTAESVHASVKSLNDMVYIDPYSTESDDIYMVYKTENYADPVLENEVICGTDDSILESDEDIVASPRGTLADKIYLRKYRLALGCTSTWGMLRGTREKAMAEMVEFVDKANVYFESMIAARLILINGNENLINIESAGDPYTNPGEGGSLVRQNTGVLNSRITSRNYDIGHLFSRCFDVGGVAAGTICGDAKGAGVTCHNGTTVTNGIVLVFVHEVGHQMSASHTFNNCPGQEGQTPSGTGWEPGSGSTIMAYPGACGSGNLTTSRDDYYHGGTIDQILSFTHQEGAPGYGCAELIDIENYRPNLSIPYHDGFFIPPVTPFYLSGKATDDNDDDMTYNWEQMDGLVSAPLGQPYGNAPLFRSVRPGKSTTRLFPNRNRVLDGIFTSVEELLPTYGRDLTFRFVARDNNPMGNGTSWEEVKFKVAPEPTGPFELISPHDIRKLKVGQKLDVEWAVNNTDQAPVNCKYVDIYFSDGGLLEFDTDNMVPAAIQVPNNGFYSVIIPNLDMPRARLVVKASDNIFFTVSRSNVSIEYPEEPAFFMDMSTAIQYLCLPDETDYEITTAGFGGLDEEIYFEAFPDEGIIATFDKETVLPGESNNMHLDLTGALETGEYSILVRTYVPGLDTLERTVRLYLTPTFLDDIQLISPENGLNGVGPTQRYHWEKRQNADGYVLQVATSPAFSYDDIVIEVERQDTFYFSDHFLDAATIYYWRVQSYNICRDGEWSEIYAFNTESKDCGITASGPISINISQSGTPTVVSEIYVGGDGRIDDVNVKNIKAIHQRAADLRVTLESPQGTQVLLWANKCPVGSGINVGVDDQSNDYFQCPINNGKIYRPEEPLSKFNGENSGGYWKLIIEDTQRGNGGRLQNWDLELCSNITLNPPILVENDTLKIDRSDTQTITRDLLRAEDQDNEDDELIYTLVSVPVHGVLFANGYPIEPGNQFTQEDINQGNLKYWNTSGKEGNDSFKFTVQDGRGGWVDITTFDIDIEYGTTSSKDLVKQPNVLVYPNPAHDVANVRCADNENISSVEVIDVTGRVVKKQSTSGQNIAVDISQMQTGIYMMRINIGDYYITRKLVKK